MSGNYYFVIVGHNDNPIFELDIPLHNKDQKNEDSRHLTRFVAHAALDLVDEKMWSTPAMYLKTVDKFNEWFVSAYVTACRMRFVLLHDVKNEDAIKNFFAEMHEVFIKHMLNPFYELNATVQSPAFEKKAQQFSKKYLTS